MDTFKQDWLPAGGMGAKGKGPSFWPSPFWRDPSLWTCPIPSWDKFPVHHGTPTPSLWTERQTYWKQYLSLYTVVDCDFLSLFEMLLSFSVNPPVPMPCPIRGRYRFKQTGPWSELIKVDTIFKDYARSYYYIRRPLSFCEFWKCYVLFSRHVFEV